MPSNFVVDSFRTKKLCSRFISSEVRFYMKTAVLHFQPLLGFRGNVRCSSYGHWKDFLSVLIEHFSLGATGEALLRANINWKSAISLQRDQFDPTFQVEGVTPTNHYSSQKTRLNDLSYGIKIWTDIFSVLSQSTCLIDWLTDTFLVASPW